MDNAANRFFFNYKPPTASTKEQLEAQAKAAQNNKAVYNRIGPKSIYKRLLTLNIFTRPNMNAYVSVKRANFAEAIRIISLDNATL